MAIFRGPAKAKLVTNGASVDAYGVVSRLWQEAKEQHPGAELLQKMTYLELRQRLAELLLMRVEKMPWQHLSRRESPSWTTSSFASRWHYLSE